VDKKSAFRQDDVCGKKSAFVEILSVEKKRFFGKMLSGKKDAFFPQKETLLPEAAAMRIESWPQPVHVL